MKIDYRAEVDSGFDRKKLVETNIIALLKEGVPLDIITHSPRFNYRHLEMISNIERGYGSKEEQVLELFGGYSKELSEQIVPDNYSGVSHPVGGELYPMTLQEEKEKFQKRDNCLIEIERLKKLEIKKIEKEKNKILNSITKYKTKYPLLDRIIDMLKELDEIKEKNMGDFVLSMDEYIQLFKKHRLNPRDFQKYEKIYTGYNELVDCLNQVTGKLEEALNSEIYNESIGELINEKNLIETEIIQRNTKLVNAFIRSKYKYLLVQTEELFQICYIAMWEATKIFDYKEGRRFSTLAYKYMDVAVKRNFKTLTGYKWDVYWTKKKIETLLKTSSEILGRKVSVEELAEYGFLSISEKRARGYLEMIDEYSLSDFYPIDEGYNEYEFENIYSPYFSDDEISDFEIGMVDLTESIDDLDMFRPFLRTKLEELLSTLTERERLVLKLRFGLEDGRARMLKEVGKTFNISPERVRLIEAKALMKLRHPSRSKKLKDFLR